MPIYEYVCDQCNKAFEQLVQRDENVSCPYCDSDDLKKQISRFGMTISSGQQCDSLPIYKGGCGCTPSTCGCKN